MPEVREMSELEVRMLQQIMDLRQEREGLILLLSQATARVRLANNEGNPILSAWLPEAEEVLKCQTRSEAY